MSYIQWKRATRRSDRFSIAFSDWGRILALASGILLSACGDERIDHATADGGAADRGADLHATADGGAQPDRAAADPDGPAAGGAEVRIYIEGDVSPMIIEDGASGQTPKSYTMGLGRFDVLRSADDPAPVTVFDHKEAPVEVDLLSRTLGGSARLADLPGGTYTHGRVLLTSARVTVAATVHLGLAVPGDLTILTALSDGTVGGKPMQQGQAEFTFQVGAAQQTVPGVVPALPTTAGGTIVQQQGQTWMIFPFPEPLTLSPAATQDHAATITYRVFESFRWQDEDKPGYQTAVFDIDAATMSYEPVTNFGATAYAVTTE